MYGNHLKLNMVFKKNEQIAIIFPKNIFKTLQTDINNLLNQKILK